MKTSSLWPAVALVGLVVVGVVVLSVTHADVSSLERLVPLIVVPLLAYLLNQVSKVKEQTNGNTSALLDTINALRTDNARQSELLAQSAPVPADTPRARTAYPAPIAPVEQPTQVIGYPASAMSYRDTFPVPARQTRDCGARPECATECYWTTQGREECLGPDERDDTR